MHVCVLCVLVWREASTASQSTCLTAFCVEEKKKKKTKSHTRFELVTYRVLSGRDNQLHQRDKGVAETDFLQY